MAAEVMWAVVLSASGFIFLRAPQSGDGILAAIVALPITVMVGGGLGLGVSKLVASYRQRSDGPRLSSDELQERRDEYAEYRDTPEWKEKAREVRARAGNRCQVCNASGPLDVHHRTYEDIFDEDLDDLIALCRDCHQRFHDSGARIT